MAEQDTPPPTITAMKIPIIRKGEYDIWSMRMRQYICHTDHNLWDVIVNGDLEEEPAPTGETSALPAPKTAKQLAAKRNQERVKSILLLAIPDEYLLKFHNVADAKSLWAAIKARFRGNEESKKMHKNVHVAPISKEDINQKFLRSLPSSWNQIALIMRNKPDIDEIDIDDLYNNLRVYEDEMKRAGWLFLDCQGEERFIEKTRKELDFKEKHLFSLDKDSKIECYKLSQKMGNFELWIADLEGIKGDDLMVTMARAMHQQMNLHHRNWWHKMVIGTMTGVKDFGSRSIYESVNREKFIIDDCDDVSEVSPVKTNETQTAKTQVDKIGQTSKKAGIGFKKIKACFVCKSTDHLIKDCDFYDKKSPEPKLKNVVNTGQRVVKPVWDNAKRVNHQKISNKLNYPQARRTFVPSGVLTRTGLVNPVRPNGKRAVHTVSTARSVSTARPFAPKTTQTSSVVRPIYPRMDNVRPRASSSQIKRSYNTKPVFRPKNLKQDVKTFGIKNMTTAGTRAVVNTGKGKMDNTIKKSRWVWRPKGNYMDHESKENGSFMLKKFEYGNPEIFLQDHAVVDSGCSSHMTGNKAYLSDYEDYNGGFVAFGSDPKGGQQEANQNAGTEDIIDAGDSKIEDESAQDCFVLPIWPSYSSTITPDLKTDEKRDANEEAEALRKKFEQETEHLVIQEGAARTSSTNIFSTVSTPAKASSTNLVNTVTIPVSTASPHEGLSLSDTTNPEEDDSEIPPLEDIYQNSNDGIVLLLHLMNDEGAVADFTNLETVVNVSPIPTSRIHSSHPTALILGDPTSAVQTRSKLNHSSGAHAFVSYVQKQRKKYS
ncbi:hypothetical protein Tco_0185356 [Tanacetum coccineum]